MATRSMISFVSYRLAFLSVGTYGIAMCLTYRVGETLVILLALPIFIWMVVSLLYHGMPGPVLKASSENAFRADGTKSEQRSSIEQIARAGIRTTLYIAMTSIVMGSVWIAIAMSFIEPIVNHEYFPEFAIAVAVSWVVLSCLIIRWLYLRLLADFYDGVKRRSREYLEYDIARIQEEQLVCGASE
jgi:hypothetical protein